MLAFVLALRQLSWSGSKHGPVAQWIARTPSEREVVGSSPIWVAIIFDSHARTDNRAISCYLQLVDHQPVRELLDFA